MQLRSVLFLAAVIVQVSSGNKSTSKTSKLNGWYSCSEYTFYGTGSSDAQTAECATYSAPLCYPGVCEAPEWADQTVDIFVKRLRAADPKTATNVWLLQGGPGFASNDLESDMTTLYTKLKGAANMYTMDHRGTGHSTILDCSAAQAATSGSPTGNTVEPSEVPSCAKALERKYGDLASFSTTSAAKDLVTLVSEFSNGKNTIVYGTSYGSLLNLFGFGVPSVDLSFTLEGDEQRVKLKVPRFDDAKSGKPKELPLYRDDEDILGILTVKVDVGKRLEHTGLKLELLGLIEVPVDRNGGYEFTTSVRELQPSGEVIEGEHAFAFEFAKVDKSHESYYGRSVKLRYVLRATLARGNYASNLVQEQDLWVQRVAPPPPVDRSIKMEVGIEDCLHIEFEYDKSRYHLKEVVIGKIFFLLVRIKIKHMELAILRRESVGSGTQRHSESETVTKFEIMDGAPVKGESVPVRLYLAPYALTPTYRNVQSRFSVKYFLNLVLVDEEDRRYFKQQEVTLWRKNI
ncbi:Alpha/Beta hydrolase fold [Phytophthora cactorum]|nr:Alpha/Beta hydrolase fold [Phytophthora cactorum]